MGYSERVGYQGTNATASILDCSGANTLTTPLSQSVVPTHLFAFVQTTFNSTGPTVITVNYRPTVGSSSGQTLLGTISIPTASAAPATFWKASSEVTCFAGGEIAFVVTTAATTAGKVFIGWDAGLSPENPANLPNAVASA